MKDDSNLKKISNGIFDATIILLESRVNTNKITNGIYDATKRLAGLPPNTGLSGGTISSTVFKIYATVVPSAEARC